MLEEMQSTPRKKLPARFRTGIDKVYYAGKETRMVVHNASQNYRQAVLHHKKETNGHKPFEWHIGGLDELVQLRDFLDYVLRDLQE
jgi:hypothetical protein